MIKILVLLFISFSAWSKTSLELVLPVNSVRQGEIATGRIIVRETQATLPALKGKNIAKTLYLLNVSPFMGKQGQLEAEAKVIFFAVPQTNVLVDNVNGEELTITWNNIGVIPTEASKSFLLADFEIPERKKILVWVLLLVGIVGAALGITWFIKRQKNKKTKLERLLKLKAEILRCNNYDEVVLMWRGKHQYLQTFPQLETQFKKLEEVLFKYQFKPSRSSVELEIVMDAYKTFQQEAAGVLNGI